MMAALHAGRETVSTLLSLGADVDAVAAGVSYPALVFAIRSGDTGTVEMLCDKTHSGKRPKEQEEHLFPFCPVVLEKLCKISFSI